MDACRFTDMAHFLSVMMGGLSVATVGGVVLIWVLVNVGGLLAELARNAAWAALLRGGLIYRRAQRWRRLARRRAKAL